MKLLEDQHKNERKISTGNFKVPKNFDAFPDNLQI